ncbi:hypothetical protein Tco_0503972 [Tanacetum coccineum]
MKWLWKNKRDEEKTVIRNKSLLVAKGYAQKEGIDFEESFTVGSCAVIRCVCCTQIISSIPDGRQDNISLRTSEGRSHGYLMDSYWYSQWLRNNLDADLSETPVDQMKYHSMVGALMYLTESRPDILHATCYCARYQAEPTEKHLTAVKRIFWYLKNTINMGLWYPKDTSFELTSFSDSDHAGCLDSQKSTSGGIQFLGGDKLVSWSSKKQDCTSMSSQQKWSMCLYLRAAPNFYG